MDSIRLVYDNALWVEGGHNAIFHVKITNKLHLHLIKYIDTNHSKGKKLAFHKILNWLRKKYAIYCSKHTLLQAIIDIGLYYKTSKPKTSNNNVARLDQIRDYLIYLHALLKLEKEDKSVLIYLDNSYCNTTYPDTHSWHLSTGNTI